MARKCWDRELTNVARTQLSAEELVEVLLGDTQDGQGSAARSPSLTLLPDL